MMHPNTQVRFINGAIGCGVFATEFIPKGTIVYVKDALELEVSAAQYAQLSPGLQEAVEKYSYIDERGFRILSWDHAKYVNHCCNCNTMSTGYGFEIAIRDILPNEEITDEYGMFNLEEEMPLSCTQPNCRQKVGKCDLDAYFAHWDEKVQAALEMVNGIDQPLYPLIEAGTREALELYLTQMEGYRSVRGLKFQTETPITLEISPNGIH